MIDLDQPVDGKATVVIEDLQGRRVRNLLSGASLAKGRHVLAWDGLDETGNVVRPGEYRWRAAGHPGIRPEYLFSFCNDGRPPWRTGSGTDMWGPDHSCLTAVASGPVWTFLAGSVAESGYAIVAVDQQGVKRMQYQPASGTGLDAVALAVDDRYLYAAHDGFFWGQHVDRTRSDWKAAMQMTLTRFDIASGQVVPFAENRRFVVVSTREVGPGSDRPQWSGASLAGMALLKGKIYLSDRASESLIALAADTGRPVGRIAPAVAGPLAGAEDRLVAVSGNQIVSIEPEQKTVKSLVAAGVALPAGLAVDRQGNLYISDAQTHTVKICDASGKYIGRLGKPGGPYAGPYDAQRMVEPRGLAVAANGWLWVTENRWNPKRPWRGILPRARWCGRSSAPRRTVRRAPVSTTAIPPYGSAKGLCGLSISRRGRLCRRAF